jgi:hypothetical protein
MKSTNLFILFAFVLNTACAQVTETSASAPALSSTYELEQRVARIERDFFAQEIRLSAFEKQHSKGRGLIYGGIASTLIGGIIIFQGDTDMMGPASFMMISGSFLTTFGGVTVLQSHKKLRKEL